MSTTMQLIKQFIDDAHDDAYNYYENPKLAGQFFIKNYPIKNVYESIETLYDCRIMNKHDKELISFLKGNCLGHFERTNSEFDYSENVCLEKFTPGSPKILYRKPINPQIMNQIKNVEDKTSIQVMEDTLNTFYDTNFFIDLEEENIEIFVQMSPVVFYISRENIDLALELGVLKVLKLVDENNV